MNLNKAVIKHYRAPIIPIAELKKKISLNETYLKEKPTWYEIEGRLQYFKIRNDFRLFTEQFFSMFGKEILGLDILDYRVAYVRTIDPVLKSDEEVTKCGLLSDNFQSSEYNYYLVSELLNSQISDFIAYGGYTLQNLLAFFKDYLDKKEYKENEYFLIKLFIADAFTHQEDRNYHNIGFKIPKIEDISYMNRLHPKILLNSDKAKSEYTIDENGNVLLKHLTPTKIYDNERILGTDHHNVFTYHEGQVWRPLFPFSNDTLFESQEQALEYQENYCDGLDPNLLELYMAYPDICKPIFERLAYESEYKMILERFQGNTSQISLSKKAEERITNIFEDKQEVLKRILKY